MLMSTLQHCPQTLAFSGSFHQKVLKGFMRPFYIEDDFYCDRFACHLKNISLKQYTYRREFAEMWLLFHLLQARFLMQ